MLSVGRVAGAAAGAEDLGAVFEPDAAAGLSRWERAMAAAVAPAARTTTTTPTIARVRRRRFGTDFGVYVMGTNRALAGSGSGTPAAPVAYDLGGGSPGPSPSGTKPANSSTRVGWATAGGG